MSNIAYLVGLPSAKPPSEAIVGFPATKGTAKARTIAEMKYSLAPMWLTLFDESNIVDWTLPRSGKERDTYAALCTTRRSGIARAKRRCASWVKAWPELSAIAAAWLAYLNKREDAYLAVETYELFGLSASAKEWRRELATLLRAADKPGTKAFHELLGHGSVRVEKSKLISDDNLGPCLAGHGKKLPWTDHDVPGEAPGASLTPIMKTLLDLAAEGLKSPKTAGAYRFLRLHTSYKQSSTSLAWMSEWEADMRYDDEVAATLSYANHVWGHQTPTKVLRFKQAQIDELGRAIASLAAFRNARHAKDLTIIAHSLGDAERRTCVPIS